MKTSTKIILSILSFLAPMLLVQLCYIATFAAFNIMEVFHSNVFWTISIIYWILLWWLMLCAIWEEA